jgi:hypothetical protein
MSDPDLFEISPDLEIRSEPVADGLPVLLIDNVFAHPEQIRRAALELNFEPSTTPYPGRTAVFEEVNASLQAFLRWALDLVNGRYLPQIPRERGIGTLTQLHSDFAIVDVHPDQLAAKQRIPHVDPVPIFGLIYLNREDRGGTLFFKRTAEGSAEPAPGYVVDSRDGFELCGRIEPVFNRLVIYPGFVPHSGEIAGDWIRSDERFSNPRLTQRLIFG